MPRLASARWLIVHVVLLAAPLAASAQDRLNFKVLQAFRSVVSEPAKSTAQIYCDGFRSALGTVVRADGYVVTKASELKGKVEVELSDRSGKRPATIVGTDPATDLALLKIDAQDLPVIAWAADESPPIGSWLATPGLGAAPLAIGVVSVGPRKITAAAAALGIQLTEDDSIAQIERVHPDTAAEKAGMQPRDIIRQVDGQAITTRQSLQEKIRSYQPDDKVDVVIERDGKEQSLKVTLGSMSQLMLGERAEFQNGLGGTLSKRRSGFPLALQHDTVLKPAECGGPIVDLDGKAVGLNIARAGRVESYALPAAVAREAIDKLLQQAAPAADSKLVDKTSPAEGEKKIQ